MVSIYPESLSCVGFRSRLVVRWVIIMGRKCSHCGNIGGHKSKTCPTTQKESLRLFGVQLEISASSSSPSMKKSFSVDCFPSSSTTPSSSTSSNSSRVNIGDNFNLLSNRYFSNGFARRTPERKKGVPWTEEEHRMFLLGLEKLGKSDWRGISRNFVTTRTPTQVASHAQKYFLRQSSLNKRKRLPSIFDVGNGNSITSVDARISGNGKQHLGGQSSTSRVASPIDVKSIKLYNGNSTGFLSWV